MKVETQFIECNGRKTQLTVGGNGPPLLYLHSALGETEWSPYLERLSQNYTVYLPAHPGFAFSAGLDTIREVDDIAWHYVDLLSDLNIDNIPVIGLSIGAWVAMELALLRPELISHLILIGAAGIRIPEVPIGEIFVDDFQEIRALCFADPNSDAAFTIFPKDPDDRALLGWLKAREATARVGWNPYLHNPRLEQHLHRVEAPTMLLWGADDRIVPNQYGQRLADLFPNSKLVIVPDCGHLVPMERPDEFHDQVCGFLK